MRAGLNEFLARGLMTQTALQSYLSVNNNSWGRFMSYKGAWQGVDNGLYYSGVCVRVCDSRCGRRGRGGGILLLRCTSPLTCKKWPFAFRAF